MKSRAWLGLFLVISIPLQAYAWGPEAHRAAAAIAAERLCRPTALELERLLDGQALAEASTWPDRIRGESRWAHTRDWHYVNIADDEPFSVLADETPGRGRLLQAIRDNLARLADTDHDDVSRRQALAFVLHLVADLHQPLHVGRAEDRGGNTRNVSFAGRETTLHRLWDGGLLRSAELRADDYQRSLAALVVLGARSWEDGTLEDWAEESRRLRPWVYDFDARRRVPLISRRYAETGRQLSALRIAQAGVRTAWLLNRLWGHC
ncbi:MAG TPA: S1/P1 nuclease [Gammaproteobacteria bacterium]|nr:S1/P1 nuclease [Gammaproteobacteria bacterium]